MAPVMQDTGMALKDFEFRHPLVVPVLTLLLLAALGGLGYQYYILYLANNSYASQVAKLSEELATATSTNQQLNDAYTQEQARNDAFERQIDDLNGTVDTLDKLAKTDPQLLAKYSKVYFLNENYTPASLDDIPKEDTFDKTKVYEFHNQALPHLEDMIEDAKDDDIDLLVLSAYRSFSTQASLKTGYKVTYGSGANAFSADQGYSEHQLGTTVDFTVPALAGGLTGFDKTEAFAWLTKRAHRYGFVLSYPANNTFYVFEPWHWRYVGKKLATDLHNDDQHFYDLDQRDINKYLIDLF
jgi:D-alanyl-D-alanine carboxypeptidase